MKYTVRHGDTLSGIAQHTLGAASRWPEIAKRNRLKDANHLFIGQHLDLPDGAKAHPANLPHLVPPGRLVQTPGTPLQHRPATTIPARAHFFVLADEVNPFRKKFVRVPRLAEIMMNPEKTGFIPKDMASKVPVGRHVLGMNNSKYISASEHPMGSPRFKGQKYWIDAQKVKEAGGSIHGADEIMADLNRIAAKSKDPTLLGKIDKVREYTRIDREVLIEGPVPGAAVKGARAMAMTRGLQVVQGVGIVMSAYSLEQAGVKSYQKGSVRPIAAETVRQAGGWGGALLGAELGGELGAAVGIETGPGAIVTGAIGGFIGGVIGFFDADLIAKHIDQ